ncbi:putative orfan [Tupanvirus soda lake]|uniref:Orfan n=2 Tax=Tupanvirus TaxID=2094720 RepID=A0AC62ABP9_9VIRU|nr:putative orfan [Tupanvirus soda lake]QKU35068.1 putative orfan [Tupanvirus soda lake]
MTEKQSTQPLMEVSNNRPTGCKQPVKRQTIFLSFEETVTLAKRKFPPRVITTTTTQQKVVVKTTRVSGQGKRKQFKAKKYLMRKKFHCYCGFEQKRFKTPNGKWLVVCSRTNEAIEKCL